MSQAIIIQQIETTITLEQRDTSLVIQQKDTTIEMTLDLPVDHAFFGGPNFDDPRNMVWM